MTIRCAVTVVVAIVVVIVIVVGRVLVLDPVLTLVLVLALSLVLALALVLFRALALSLALVPVRDHARLVTPSAATSLPHHSRGMQKHNKKDISEGVSTRCTERVY